MTNETLITTIFFLVPGFLGVQVYRLKVIDEDLTTFELTTWSLIYSVLGTLLLAVSPWTRNAVSYVYEPSSLTGASLYGVALQIVASSAIAYAVGHAITYCFRRRIGSDVVLRRAWDYLWMRHGRESRMVLVETEEDWLYGLHHFADGMTLGRDLILANPYRYDEDAADFYSDGSKFLYVAGSRIKTVALTVASSPSKDDAPYPGPGYLADISTSPTMESEQEACDRE